MTFFFLIVPKAYFLTETHTYRSQDIIQKMFGPIKDTGSPLKKCIKGGKWVSKEKTDDSWQTEYK